MKIKLDENLPAVLASILSDLGHDADTVIDENLGGKEDALVWAAARAEDRFLITQDLDFSDIRQFVPGTHAGILLVRLSNPGRMQLVQRIEVLFRAEDVERWRGAFVVLTDHKLRIRWPREQSTTE